MAIRVNVSFEEKILERMDEESKKMGISRSAFIAVAVNQYLMQIDNVQAVKDVKSMLDKLERLTQFNIDD